MGRVGLEPTTNGLKDRSESPDQDTPGPIRTAFSPVAEGTVVLGCPRLAPSGPQCCRESVARIGGRERRLRCIPRVYCALVYYGYTRSCRPESNPECKADLALHLKSVINATGELSKVIRESIEREALDYNQTVMLLPHWLAKEMGWDFDVSS